MKQTEQITRMVNTEPLQENSVLDPTPKRRKGRVVDEFAREAQTTVHKARQAIELLQYAPELLDRVAKGEMRLSQAVRIVREFRPIKHRKEQTTFTEEVTRSFKRWARSKWQADALPQVREIIHELTRPR